jgi:hypothetical protein
MRSVVAKERAPWSYKARLSNKLQESFIRTLLAVEHDHEYQGPDKTSFHLASRRWAMRAAAMPTKARKCSALRS